MRNYFSKKFFYFKKYRFVRQINIGLYAYKRLLFKRKKRENEQKKGHQNFQKPTNERTAPSFPTPPYCI